MSTLNLFITFIVSLTLHAILLPRLKFLRKKGDGKTDWKFVAIIYFMALVLLGLLCIGVSLVQNYGKH